MPVAIRVFVTLFKRMVCFEKVVQVVIKIA